MRGKDGSSGKGAHCQDNDLSGNPHSGGDNHATSCPDRHMSAAQPTHQISK